jgi:HAD superfamily hydrolase (TIGR01509 family)
MIRGVAFDLEGTVLDLEWAHWGGHLKAAQEVGVQLTQSEAIVRIPHFVGGPDEEIAREISALSQGRATPDQVLARDKAYFRDFLATTPRFEPRPGFLQVLASLKEMGVPVTLGSLTERVLAMELLAKSGLLNEFDRATIVLKEDVEHLKPSPDVYLRTASVLGIQPSEQLVFEDSVNGVKAASTAGSIPVAVPTVTDPAFVTELLQGGARRVFFQWGELDIRGLLASLGPGFLGKPVAKMNKDALDLMTEEYKHLTDEIERALGNRLTILGLGLATIGVILGFAVKAFQENNTALPSTALAVMVPGAAFMTVFLWMSEIRRGRRASWYVWGLERRINRELCRRVLRWEEAIRPPEEHRLLALFREHYYITVSFFLIAASVSAFFGACGWGFSLCMSLLWGAAIALIMGLAFVPDLRRFPEFDKPGEEWPAKVARD